MNLGRGRGGNFNQIFNRFQKHVIIADSFATMLRTVTGQEGVLLEVSEEVSEDNHSNPGDR